MSFEDLVNCQFIRGVFLSLWMTSNENFKIIKKIEAENAKRKKSKKKKKTLRKKQWQKPEK